MGYIIASVLCFMLFTRINNKIHYYKWKKRGRWADLDKWLPPLDKNRKIIDGPYYREEKYVIISSEYVTMTLNNPSIARWILRYMAKYYNTTSYFTSDKILGKLIIDRGHAKRYINDNRPFTMGP